MTDDGVVGKWKSVSREQNICHPVPVLQASLSSSHPLVQSEQLQLSPVSHELFLLQTGLSVSSFAGLQMLSAEEWYVHSGHIPVTEQLAFFIVNCTSP